MHPVLKVAYFFKIYLIQAGKHLTPSVRPRQRWQCWADIAAKAPLKAEDRQEPSPLSQKCNNEPEVGAAFIPSFLKPPGWITDRTGSPARTFAPKRANRRVVPATAPLSLRLEYKWLHGVKWPFILIRFIIVSLWKRHQQPPNTPIHVSHLQHSHCLLPAELAGLAADSPRIFRPPDGIDTHRFGAGARPQRGSAAAQSIDIGTVEVLVVRAGSVTACTVSPAACFSPRQRRARWRVSTDASR